MRRPRNRQQSFARFEALEPRLAPAVFYVAPAGNDLAAGSAQAPWKTLQHAADLVAPGDQVIVRPGHYAGLDLGRSGTAAAPIVFRGEPGAVIDRPNQRTPDGINLEGANFVTIEGFTLLGLPRAGIRSVVNEHVTIRGNRADQNGRWGIFTGFSDDLRIENNECSRSADEHGIYVSNSGDRPIVRHNKVWGNRGNGIHLNGDESQGGDGIISGALVEGNVIFGNGTGGGSGINADGVQNSRIQNNLLYDNHASGISLYRIDGAASSTGNVVANNTVVQAADGRWALNIRDASTGNTVVNNIFYSFHSYRGSISVDADSLPGLASDYNVLMDRFTTDGGDSRLSLAQWQAATGQDRHSRLSTPAALFIDAAAGNYHLKLQSPAVDAGTTAQAPASDLEGVGRPQGDGCDVGAYELAVATLMGDANRDGRVDLADFGVLKAHFGGEGGWSWGDFSGDGQVDLADFGLLKGNFGRSDELDDGLLLALAIEQARSE
jgi:parallel beta-helix repeat protein